MAHASWRQEHRHSLGRSGQPWRSRLCVNNSLKFTRNTFPSGAKHKYGELIAVLVEDGEQLLVHLWTHCKVVWCVEADGRDSLELYGAVLLAKLMSD